MAEKYRLQYWNPRETSLSINWVGMRQGDKRPHEIGDCRVRAIRESTDIKAHNESHFQKQKYTEPMTLDDVRNYITQNNAMLGEVHDCVGLTLEDACIEVEFSEPIQIRNMKTR